MVGSRLRKGGFALAALASLGAIGLEAQEAPKAGGTDPVPPAAVLQEKVREWVRVQKLRGEEGARWEEQKRELAGLNALRRREIEQIDELITAAGRRLEEAAGQREELRGEQASLRAARAKLAGRIGALEEALRARLPLFPPSLRDKVPDAIVRLEGSAADRPLQDRYRDVVAVLGAAGEFARSLTVAEELREVDGQNVQVEVLYLGLAQAWYVGRGGKVAGSGRAGAAGWIWTEDRRLAGEVRSAIDIHRKQRSPGYVRLPFEANAGGGQ